MQFKELQKGIINYATNEVIPNLTGTSISVLGFNIPITPQLVQLGMGVGVGMSNISLEKYLPIMQKLGVVNTENEIDGKKLVDILKGEFSKLEGEVLKVGRLTFGKSDIDTLASYLGV